jgi:hypothetical protein
VQRRLARGSFAPLLATGPRAAAVIDAVALRLDLLDWCEHLSGGEGRLYWISTRPSRLLCAFCWQAAQVIGQPRCGFCDASADDPARDVMIVAKVAAELALHFYLCAECVQLDRSDAGR